MMTLPALREEEVVEARVKLRELMRSCEDGG
jgi:hypothetical protein